VTGWAALHELIERCDEAAVASAVRDLAPGQRRELAEPLRRYERLLRDQDRFGLWWRRQPGLAVAGAAVLPGAAVLAPWLARNSLRRYMPGLYHRTVTDLVLDVLRARDAPWLGDLAGRLAARLTTRSVDADLWQLVSDLVTLTGIDPPTTDGFVLGWTQHHGGSVAGEIRRDARLAALIPRLFEIERLAVSFRWGAWPETLARLAAEGLVDRAVLLDSCLAALQRGGRLGAAQGYLRVHEALAPAGSEVAPRAADYAALLPDSHSVVAAMAQRELRRLDEAGGLPAGMLSQIGRAVLARTEKTLVRAQLGWLDAAARRDPGHAPELVLAMAAAFGQHAADMQRLALTSAVRHLSRLDAATRAELAAAARGLPADLHGVAAGAFGGDGHPRPGGGEGMASAPAPQLPPWSAPRDLPPPIGSPEELAAEIASVYPGTADVLDPAGLERVLAGVVAFACTDRSALAAALGRFLARNPWIAADYAPDDREDLSEGGRLDAIIRAAIVAARGPVGGRYPAAREVRGETARLAALHDAHWEGPRAGLARRLHEIAVGLAYAPRPFLLSTPTTGSGLIDPAGLVSRMRRAAADGWEPWEVDLAQALLRLPRDPDPAAAAAARELATPAARTVAQRLAAGSPPDPQVNSETRTVSKWVYLPNRGYRTKAKEQVLLATAASRAPGQPGDPSTLARELNTPEAWHGSDSRAGWMSCWPLMLPAHRDVAAAHLVPHLAGWTRSGRGGAALLPALADADGPVADGMNLAVAYGLGATDRADRAAAVDAMITLAARGQLDGAALGRQVGTLTARGDLLLNRVVPGLRDVANVGAPGPVWALVAAALAQLLPPAGGQPPHRLAALVELGVDLVDTCRPAATLPCLEPVVAQRGASQLVTQARRLRQALSRTVSAP